MQDIYLVSQSNSVVHYENAGVVILRLSPYILLGVFFLSVVVVIIIANHIVKTRKSNALSKSAREGQDLEMQMDRKTQAQK